MISDETHSLGLPDFPVDNLHAIVQILVIGGILLHLNRMYIRIYTASISLPIVNNVISIIIV